MLARVVRAQPSAARGAPRRRRTPRPARRGARSASNAHGLKALVIRRAATLEGGLTPPGRRAAPRRRYDMTQGTAGDFARRHVEEIINRRRPDLVDELYAPDAVYHDPVALGGTAR